MLVVLRHAPWEAAPSEPPSRLLPRLVALTVDQAVIRDVLRLNTSSVVDRDILVAPVAL